MKRRRRNPGKFDRCVAQVTRRGGSYNPYAVCASSLKMRRRRNPRGIGARHWFRLIAKRGDTRLVYVGANKFSRRGQPVYFPTVKAAEATARWLARNYDALRGFSFHAVEN